MHFSLEQLKDLLKGIKTIAIIGAKDKEGAEVNGVGSYLISAGYKVLPVHPKRKDVWGLATYPDIASLPEVPDAVVLFRASEYCAGHAREVLDLPGKPKVFWMQSGIFSPEAMNMMRDAGINAVQNQCIKVSHRILFGSGTGGSI